MRCSVDESGVVMHRSIIRVRPDIHAELCAPSNSESIPCSFCLRHSDVLPRTATRDVGQPDGRQGAKTPDRGPDAAPPAAGSRGRGHLESSRRAPKICARPDGGCARASDWAAAPDCGLVRSRMSKRPTHPIPLSTGWCLREVHP